MGQQNLLELHSRILVVFSWDSRANPLNAAVQALSGVQWKDKPCWTLPDPISTYRAEFFDFVQQFLFQCDVGPRQKSCHSYLRMDPNLHNQIFGNFLALDYDLESKPQHPRPSVKTFCAAKPG